MMHSVSIARVKHLVCVYTCICCYTLMAPSARSQTPSGDAGVQRVIVPARSLQLPRSAVDSATTDLLIRARAPIEQFHDRKVAIASGYRRLGMDFPSMGEHWVNPGIILAGRFDISRPAMLSYATIVGEPVLIGLVYAVALAPGEEPPVVPGASGMWHEHNGTVDDESMLPEHRSNDHAHSSAHGHGHDTMPMSIAPTRLAVLHAWTGIANPAGIFAAENWAIPFARLGLATPIPVSISAARALSLLSGGKEYYVALANANGGNSDSGFVAVSTILDQCARTAELIAAGAHAAGVLTPADITRLDGAWAAALSQISREVGPLAAERLNGGHPVATATPR